MKLTEFKKILEFLTPLLGLYNEIKPWLRRLIPPLATQCFSGLLMWSSELHKTLYPFDVVLGLTVGAFLNCCYLWARNARKQGEYISRKSAGKGWSINFTDDDVLLLAQARYDKKSNSIRFEGDCVP